MASNAAGSKVRVLSAGAQLEVPRRGGRPRDELWLSVGELHEVSGWRLQPEGLCRGDRCQPLRGDRAPKLAQDLVCASDLWKSLGRPVLHDRAGDTWLLGEAAEERSRELATLMAPDFALPDIDGTLHRLSDQRGKKVLLVTWASW